VIIRALTVISLAVAGLAVVAWVASHVVPQPELLLWSRPHQAGFASSHGGRLCLWTQSIAPPPPAGCTVLIAPLAFRVTTDGNSFQTSYAPHWPRPDEGWDRVQKDTLAVVYVGPTRYAFTLRIRHVLISWWMVMAPALVLPAVALARRYARRRRVVAGRCGECGYDLRASPDRCPECGTPAPAGTPPPVTASPQSHRTPHESDAARRP
jgi:hypothetical protein